MHEYEYKHEYKRNFRVGVHMYKNTNNVNTNEENPNNEKSQAKCFNCTLSSNFA